MKPSAWKYVRNNKTFLKITSKGEKTVHRNAGNLAKARTKKYIKRTMNGKRQATQKGKREMASFYLESQSAVSKLSSRT
jgi:hypothetical protein